jgi:hypothetical protein
MYLKKDGMDKKMFKIKSEVKPIMHRIYNKKIIYYRIVIFKSNFLKKDRI